MRKFIYLAVFLTGVLITFFIMKNSSKNDIHEASTTIAYGIKRLNKMVVAEQNYANFYSHKSTNSYLGDLISFDKNILLKVNIKAQASYDLSKMEVKIDSTNQTIFIKKIPKVKIETFSDVEFFEINQSKLNRFEKNDLNDIKNRAIVAVEKEIDYSTIKIKAEKQLIENLEDIYILAKIYGWKVQNDTKFDEKLRANIKL